MGKTSRERLTLCFWTSVPDTALELVLVWLGRNTSHQHRPSHPSRNLKARGRRKEFYTKIPDQPLWECRIFPASQAQARHTLSQVRNPTFLYLGLGFVESCLERGVARHGIAVCRGRGSGWVSGMLCSMGWPRLALSGLICSSEDGLAEVASALTPGPQWTKYKSHAGKSGFLLTTP